MVEVHADVHSVSILCYIISPHGVAVMSHKTAQTRVKGAYLTNNNNRWHHDLKDKGCLFGKFCM